MNSDFEIKDNILIKYYGNSEEVIIPEGVSCIGEDAFRDCESLIHVVIPEGVTEIANNAFRRCLNLTEIILPESLISIGDTAFFACISLKSITIPKSVKTIGKEAFESCKNLTSVTLQEGLVTIKELAFAQCKSLTEITIPKSLETLGYIAFLSCRSMKRIPMTLTEGKLFYIPENNKDVPDFKMNEIILKRNYSIRIDLEVKYDVIFQMFMLEVDFEGVSDYIKKNFSKMFRWLIENEKIEIIQKVLDSGMFITKRNIDNWIQYAIENQKHQVQLLLTDYKYQHFEFKPIKEKFRL